MMGTVMDRGPLESDRVSFMRNVDGRRRDVQHGGAEAVDALPGGRQWRDTVEALEPARSRRVSRRAPPLDNTQFAANPPDQATHQITRPTTEHT